MYYAVQSMTAKSASNPLMNTKEAAQFLRVSEASIRRWSDAGLLSSRRVGRRRERRFAASDLTAFLNQPSSRSRPALTDVSAVSVGGSSVPMRSHIAPIYGTDAGGLRLSIPFLADGLRAGHHCYLAAAGVVLNRSVDALSEEGLDLDAANDAGLLTIVGWPGASVQGVIANWERLFAKALAGGPTVIRVVGEMASERTMFASDAEMLAYEEAYDLMARRYPAVTLCQYDAREFNGATMLRALKAHPDMFERHLGGFLN